MLRKSAKGPQSSGLLKASAGKALKTARMAAARVSADSIFPLLVMCEGSRCIEVKLGEFATVNPDPIWKSSLWNYGNMH